MHAVVIFGKVYQRPDTVPENHHSNAFAMMAKGLSRDVIEQENGVSL